MKVLHVLNTGTRNFGGKERSTLELIAALREKGVSAELVCLRAGLTDELAQKMKIPTVVPIVKKPENINFVFAVADIIRGGGFEIVHTHDFRENLIGRLAARRAKVPVITTVHGLAKLCLDLPWIKRAFYNVLDMLTAKMSSRFIVLSESDKKILGKNFPQDKICIIPLAIKPIESPFARRVEGKKTFVFGSAGRLDKQKGFDILAKAAKDIISEGADVRFVVAGTGPRENELKELVAKLGIEKQFEFLGFVENMDNFYNSLDAFVLPSLVERSPLVVLEAQARGLFVIATDVGAVSEMLKDGETGFVIRAGDKNALKDALSRVLQNRALFERARAQAVNFKSTFDEMVEKTICVYKGVLK